MGQVNVNFDKGVPLLPFDHLLSVLPPRSASALPEAYAQLMLDEQSRLLDLYHPQNIEGKLQLPYIDESRLLAETRELEKGLSESEAIRNTVNVDSLFVGSTSKLAEKISSLSPESNKSDTTISDGIGGIISLCHDQPVEKPYKQENCVFCVNYELPAGGSSGDIHIPYLLPGVNLPDKTIFEDDIKETVLWHERQHQKRRFERLHQGELRNGNSEGSTSKFPPNACTQRPNLSLNAPPEVIFKGAGGGPGWGSGRGRPDHSSNMNRIDERMSSFSPFNNNNQQPKDGGSYYNHPRSQSETMPFGRGRGRLQPNSNNAYSWRDVSSNDNSSLRPQWIVAKEDHQSRW